MRGHNRWLNAALLVLAGPAALVASPCVSETLFDYIALGSDGSTIQTNSVLFTNSAVKDFVFAVVDPIIGAPARVASTDISVPLADPAPDPIYIPEPGGPLLVAAALAVLAWWRRRLSEP
jgi:hypothetical protein